jgi:hypothetical protein
MGHARLASGGQLLIRSAAPVWADAGSSGRTSPAHDTRGSVIPRVTPAATGHGPDHHRTTGSLTVIPMDIPHGAYCTEPGGTDQKRRPT